ncbi:cadherin-like domain-containing protein [Romeriopsis navalis]|uniref:cadherin-like domain-containing protein n=1 Tax=Romeriopsis navalis TaxID=2992132 RepID=UPI0021F87C9D|nr:cadherin-like domain-containing protein [Romeriopsis navalis]
MIGAVNDGGGNTASDDAASQTDNDIVFGSVINPRPILTLPSTTPSYTENAEPRLLDTTATVTDDDSTDFDTGTLTVRFSANGIATDRLTIRNEGTGSTQINLNGTNVRYGSTVIGTYTGGNGTDNLVITFNAAANPTNVQALVRNLSYSNISEALVDGTRTVELVLTDGDGGTSTAVTKNVNVTGENDAPVNTINLTSGNGIWQQLGLEINGAAADDQSGRSVSLSSDGRTVAIGASRNDGNGADSGHVRMYRYNGSVWQQLGSDINGEAASDQLGGSVSLSADGNTVAIGAPQNDGNGSNSGHVQLYRYNGSVWQQLGSDINGEAAGDSSGQSVSLSSDGNTVAIGTAFNDDNGTDSGHVRLYRYDGSVWNQLGSDLDGEAADDRSGISVSLSADGNTVAIGAIFNDGNGSSSGHVRLYRYDGSVWNQLGSDLDGESTEDRSGASVSLSSDGNTVAIGAPAPLNIGTGNGNGYVRLYRYDGSVWQQLGSDLDGEALGDNSGDSVSLSSDGNTVAIGASRNNGNGGSSGHVRLYRYDGNNWQQLGSDLDGEADGDRSGISVALASDGNTVAIGAPFNDGNGSSSGHVRLYQLLTQTVTVDEDTALSLAGITVDDAEGNLATTQLSVSNGTLNVTLAGSASISNGGSGSSSLTLSGSQADINATLSSLTYQGNLNFNGNDSLTIVSTDGEGTPLSDTDTIVIQVNPVNDAPELTLPGGTAAYTENAPSATLLDATATVSDVDSTDFNTGTLTVRVSADGTADDRLTIRNQGTGTTDINLDGTNVRYGSTVIGTYTGGTGTDNLVITLNAAANPTNVQALVRNLSYSNVSEALVDGTRTVELVLTDGDGGTSNPGTQTVNVTGENDAPLIGAKQTLYDGTTVPSSQGWFAVTTGAVEANDGTVTTLNTSASPLVQAGYSRNDVTLNATNGFLLSFQANVLSETLEATANKNNDGKTDRAVFSLTLVTSDTSKAIELGFSRDGGNLRIFAQEDGTRQSNPALEPDTAPADTTRQLFTQAEGVTITDPNLGNYDLYIKGDTYTLLLGGTAILSGNLRDYTAFSGPIDPYETANLISFSDNTPSASGAFSLGTVSLISGGIADQTINEDAANNALNFGVFDIEGDTVSVTPSSTNTTLTPNSGITLSGSGTSQTITVTPTADGNGNSDITLTANDGNTNSTDTFTLTVNPVNDAPVLSNGPSATGFAGVDVTTNDAWRTSTVSKPLDLDGDNIYGSDGFYLYSSGSHTRTSPPAYATVSQVAGTLNYPGNGNYIQFDNPDQTGPGPVANVITGLVYNQPGAGVETDWLDISFTTAGRYRVGIVTDNTDFVPISPADFRLRQTAGGTIDTGFIAASGDRDRDIDYYFFDVIAEAGDVFRLSGRNDGGHPSNGIGGVFFDSLAIPVLDAVNEDAIAPVGAVGTLISALVDLDSVAGGNNNIADADANPLVGIALTNTDTTNGSWFYTIDGGNNWSTIGAISETNARLLAANADTRLYFQPNANFNGDINNAITFRAWDQTSGSNGSTSNSSINGDATSFSTATSTAKITVNPVNDAATITTNTLSIAEGATLTLSSANITATDIDNSPTELTFAATNITNGEFQLVSNGTTVTSFTQQQINNGDIQFVHDGTENPPSYDLIVNDGNVDSQSSTVTIPNGGFTGINDAATITTNTLSISEEGTLTLSNANITATDPDNSATELTFTANNISNGEFQLVSNGSTVTSFTQQQINDGDIQFIHDGTENPPSYDLTVNDGNVDSQSSTVAIPNGGFTGVNDAATITANTLSISEGGTLTLGNANITATDPDNSATELTFTASNVTNGEFQLVSNGTTVTSFTQQQINDGDIQFVHDGTENPPSYDLTVNDGNVDSQSSTVAIPNGGFTSVNDAATITANTLSISEGGTLTLGNANITATDPDNIATELTFTASNISNGEFQLVSNSTTVNSFTQQQINNGDIQFVHDGTENPPSYDLTVNDGNIDSQSSTVTIPNGGFTGVNDAATITTNTLSISEGGTLTLGSANISATDPDNSPTELTFTASNVTNGEFQLVSNGTTVTSFTQQQINNGDIQFVHDGTENPPSYDLTVNDGTIDSPVSTLTIPNGGFTGVNDAATITANTLSISEGATLTLSNANITATDPDNSATELTFTASNVTNGEFQLVSNGTTVTSFTQQQINNGDIQFVHDGTENPPSYDLTVNDGTVDSPVSTLTIPNGGFTSVNDAATITTNTLSISEGGTLTLGNANITVIDSDNSPTELTFAATNVTNGEFQLVSNGTTVTSFTQQQINDGDIQFVHDGAENPPSYNLTVNDGTVDSSSSTVTIPNGGFTSINDAATITTNTLSISEGGTLTLGNANITATDPDNSATELTFTASNVTNGQFQLVSSGSIVTSFTQQQINDGDIQFVHDGTENPPSYDLIVNDGNVDSQSSTVTIPNGGFTGVNDAATITTNTLSISEGGTLTLDNANITATDPDNSATELTFTANNISNGEFQLVSNGSTVTSFTQQQINDGDIQFVHDGTENPPSYDLTVNDGNVDSPVSTITIPNGGFTSVNDAATITTNTLSISEGATLTLSNANITATDPDNSATELTFTASNISNGEFQLVSNGTTVTSFTQQQINDGDIQFVHDGTENPPSYDLTVNDGTVDSPVSTLTIPNGGFTGVNDPPTALTLTNQVTTLSEAADTTVRIKVADLNITDDLTGNNVINLTGADADKFEVDGNALYFKANTPINFEVRDTYQIFINVDDVTVGNSPDLSESFTLTITNADDPLRGTVTVNGNSIIGNPLSVTNTLTDEDGIANLDYQWQSSNDGTNWTNIPTATNPTFAPTTDQLAQQIRVQVTSTDNQNNTAIVFSPGTAPVQGVVLQGNLTTPAGVNGQNVDNWASDLTQPGYPAGLTYVVTVDRPELFQTLPTLTPDGTLNYTPKPNVNVNADVNLTVQVKRPDGTIDADLTRSATLAFKYKAEALLRNSTSGEIGLLYVDQVNQVQKRVSFTYGSSFGTQAGEKIQIAADRAIADTADFNRDGIADVLTYTAAGDEVAIWIMGNNGVVNAIQTLKGQAGQILRTGNQDWQVIGFTDIDQDNNLDIVWHNQQSDEVAFWFMQADGVTVREYDYLRDAQGNVFKTGNNQWQVKAVTDFDGDGDADLLFRLPALNQTAIVRLDGRTFLEAQYVQAPPANDLVIRGVADSNGDQIADIYWQSPDNANVLLQTITFSNGQFQSDNFTTIASNAPLQAIADLDLNNTNDLLFQNPTTNAVIVNVVNPNQPTVPNQVLQQAGVDFQLGDPNWQFEQADDFGDVIV